jgi:amidophosphoribosyltransferase
MHEKCGVVGVSLSNREAARPLYYSLYALQHRGQESAGIVTHDGFQQHEHVEMGLVGDAFSPEDLDTLNGSNGIGHVRYPTAGGVNSSCAQPFSVSFKSGSLGLAHNGNLVNAAATNWPDSATPSPRTGTRRSSHTTSPATSSKRIWSVRSSRR